MPPNEEKINTCANFLTGTNNYAIFRWGRIGEYLHSFAMKLATHQIPQRCKRLVPLLAAPAALLLGQGQAKAILNVNIFDDGPNLRISVSGSLSQLPAVAGTGDCGATGALAGEFQTALLGYNNFICSGPDVTFNLYDITGKRLYFLVCVIGLHR
jgi:hypothetical protein